MKTLQDKIVAGAAVVIATALGFIWTSVNDSRDKLTRLEITGHICTMDLVETEREFYRLNERLHEAEKQIALLEKP